MTTDRSSADPLKDRWGFPNGAFPAAKTVLGNPDTKPTNPKDIVAMKKLSLGLVPDTCDVEVALAFLEGALKYGRYNWRIAGVSTSVYVDAIKRHLAKFWNGQNRDKKTRVKHLASIIACATIIMDAELCLKLNDDRPPAAPLDELIDEADDIVAHLQELFKDHKPHQYTIKDPSIPIPTNESVDHALHPDDHL